MLVIDKNVGAPRDGGQNFGHVTHGRQRDFAISRIAQDRNARAEAPRADPVVPLDTRREYRPTSRKTPPCCRRNARDSNRRRVGVTADAAIPPIPPPPASNKCTSALILDKLEHASVTTTYARHTRARARAGNVE